MRQSVHLYKHTHIAAIVTVNAGAHGVITQQTCVCSHTVYDNVSMYWTTVTIVGTVSQSCNADV